MPTLTRRDALRLSAVVAGTAVVAPVLSACTRDGGQPAPTEPGGPEDPDRALRAEIGQAESGLIALYAAAGSALSGGTAVTVRSIGERHEAYRQAIDPDDLASLPPSALATGSGSAGTTGSPSSTPTPAPTLPRDRAGVLAALRGAESEAAAARAAQSVRAVDAELARVVVLAGTGAAGAEAALRRVAP